MPEALPGEDQQSMRIVLGLLESVGRDGQQSQRKLAAELGIALGLVNAYLKRCITKGYVKVRAVPTRRYAYYLTPKGFAEKSRLTVDYFSSSFSFFRQARADCSAALKSASESGFRDIALLGVSDLAEIAILCAMEKGIAVRAVVDPEASSACFVGIPIVPSLDAIALQVDGALVTDLKTTQQVASAAAAILGAHRVMAPALLHVRLDQAGGSE